MASLSVRNLDESVHRRLRVRAAKHGVSMEEEVRQIIIQAVTVPERMSSIFRKAFGGESGISLKTPKGKTHQPLDFND